MKKTLLFLTATALLAGCAGNEVKDDVVVEEIAIGFGDSNIGKITRANAGEMTASSSNGTSSGTLCTDGNTMEVWGWKYNANTDPAYTKIFDNQVVKYTSSSSQTSTKWVYSPIKYWDRFADYTFYAVAPDGKFTMPDENLTTAANRVLKAQNVPAVQVLMNNAGAAKIKLATDGDAVTGEKSTAIDYLVAEKRECAKGEATQGNATDKDVTFTFYHILSKLDVNVLTTSTFTHTGSDYPQIKLTDLKINLAGMCPTWDQKTAGALTPSTTDGDTWSGTAASATDYICFDVDDTNVTEARLLSTTAFTTASYFVAPTATGTTPAQHDVKIQVEYDIIYAASGDASVEHCQSDLLTVTNLKSFVQNTYNKLNITIDPQAILFDVEEVKDWTNGTTGTITVQ